MTFISADSHTNNIGSGEANLHIIASVNGRQRYIRYDAEIDSSRPFSVAFQEVIMTMTPSFGVFYDGDVEESETE
jgi:hypothetical protein